MGYIITGDGTGIQREKKFCTGQSWTTETLSFHARFAMVVSQRARLSLRPANVKQRSGETVSTRLGEQRKGNLQIQRRRISADGRSGGLGRC